MKIRVHVIPALLALAMAGCAGVAGMMGAHVNAHPGKTRPIEEVAVLLNPGMAQLAKVDGKRYGDNLVMGYPSDLRVLPGEHVVGLDCMWGDYQVTPTEFTGTFEAGHFYYVNCHAKAGGKFVAGMKDLGTVDPRKK